MKGSNYILYVIACRSCFAYMRSLIKLAMKNVLPTHIFENAAQKVTDFWKYCNLLANAHYMENKCRDFGLS